MPGVLDHTETCPTCGGPVRIGGDATGDGGTHYLVPALSGAQADAAERLAFAVVRMAVAGGAAQFQDELQQAYQAAADFGHAGSGQSLLARALAAPPGPLTDYQERVQNWVERFRQGED